MADLTTSAGPKARKKPGRKKGLSLSRFDKDVAKLIQQGVVRLDALSAKLGVDPLAVQKRLATLVEKDLLVFDARTGEYRLGIAGYNKFAPKLKNATAKKTTEPEKTKLSEKDVVFVVEEKTKPETVPSKNKNATLTEEKTTSKEPRSLEDSDVDVTDVLNASRKELEAKNSLKQTKPAQVEPVDLGALLEKGRPSTSRPSFKPGEMCELCRAPFKVSVKEPAAAKFAHCVCGSAYHKDCYDSLLQEGGRCARCGRKLAPVLDQSSEESLKDIKDAFE